MNGLLKIKNSIVLLSKNILFSFTPTLHTRARACGKQVGWLLKLIDGLMEDRQTDRQNSTARVTQNWQTATQARRHTGTVR